VKRTAALHAEERLNKKKIGLKSNTVCISRSNQYRHDIKMYLIEQGCGEGPGHGYTQPPAMTATGILTRNTKIYMYTVHT